MELGEAISTRYNKMTRPSHESRKVMLDEIHETVSEPIIHELIELWKKVQEDLEDIYRNRIKRWI